MHGVSPPGEISCVVRVQGARHRVHALCEPRAATSEDAIRQRRLESGRVGRCSGDGGGDHHGAGGDVEGDCPLVRPLGRQEARGRRHA